MPYVRKRRINRRKPARKGGYKRDKYTRRTRIPRPAMGAFPNTTVAKLKYCDIATINPGIGTFAGFYMRANSLFDPVAAAGGHQPMGFDQWAALYMHYVVLGSKIKCTFMYTDTTDTSPCGCALRLQDGNGDAMTSWTHVIETARQKHTVYANAKGGPGKTAVVLTKKFSAKKFFNVADVKDNITRIGALCTADPGEQAYFQVGCASFNGTDPSAMTVLVEMDFIALFSEPKPQPQS